MELRQLEYFHEICRRGGVTAAAESLHVSQPSVTAGIKRLEEELGVLLFDRTNRRLTVTSAGTAFQEDVKNILQLVEDAGRKMQDYGTEAKGIVRIGITPMMSANLLPQVIARYQRAYPQVELHVVEEGSLSIASRLRRRELDVGILIIQELPTRLVGKSIRKGELMVCLPPGHALADHHAISLASLKDEPFIMVQEDAYSRQLILQECGRLAFEPHIVFTSSQISTVAGLVREGMGIAFFFEDIAKSLDSIETRPLIPSLELEASVVWNREHYLSTPARLLIDAFAPDVR